MESEPIWISVDGHLPVGTVHAVVAINRDTVGAVKVLTSGKFSVFYVVDRDTPSRFSLAGKLAGDGCAALLPGRSELLPQSNGAAADAPPSDSRLTDLSCCLAVG